MIKIVEKNNHLAVHGIFETMERATLFLGIMIPSLQTNGKSDGNSWQNAMT